LLWNPVNAFHVVAVKGWKTAAKAFRMKVLSLGVRTSEELGRRVCRQFWLSGPARWWFWADRVFLHARDGS